jgi:hypothetical protein
MLHLFINVIILILRIILITFLNVIKITVINNELIFEGKDKLITMTYEDSNRIINRSGANKSLSIKNKFMVKDLWQLIN